MPSVAATLPVMKYIAICGFCLVVCLILAKQTFYYQNITLVTFTSRDQMNKLTEIGNKMVNVLTGDSPLADKKRMNITTRRYLATTDKPRIHVTPHDASVGARPEEHVPNMKKTASRDVSTDSKIILWFVKPRFIQYSTKLFDLPQCQWKCQETTNHEFYNRSDAIVFAAQTMRIPPPPRTKHDQVFVLHNHEAPHDGWRKKPSFRQKIWNKQINWTMSYRVDSDIVYPYGVIRKRLQIPEKNYTEIIQDKSKLIAWMSSHCKTNSKREQYVRNLHKYVTVDAWGGCGTKRCPRRSETICRQLITKDYKFYLSFENTLCEDYVTEKFFRQYNENLITIVRGGKHFSHIAPRGVCINTADFTTPQALADYLKYLDSNDTAYEDMLRKKDLYQAMFEKYELRSGGHLLYTNYHYKMAAMCNLCERLWNKDKYRHVYDDVTSWFDSKLCDKPQDVE